MIVDMVYLHKNWWERGVVYKESNLLSEASGQRQSRDWYYIRSCCVCEETKQPSKSSI